MAHTVIHHPRLAWDGARALVWAAGSYQYIFVASELGRTLGDHLQLCFAETHDRLLAGGSHDLEAGRWRIRLQEMLAQRPDLAPALMEITRKASGT